MGGYFSASRSSGGQSSDPAAKESKQGAVAVKKASIRLNLTKRVLGTMAAVFAIAGCFGLISYFMGGIASFIIAFIAPLLSTVLVLTCCVMVPVCLSPDLWKEHPWNMLLLAAVTFVQGSLCFLMAGYSRSLAIPVGFMGAAVSCAATAGTGMCINWQPGILNSIAIGALPSIVFGTLMFIDPSVSVLTAIVGMLLGSALGVWALVRVRAYVGGPDDPIPQPGGSSSHLTVVLLVFTEAFTATFCNPLRWYGADKLFSDEQKQKASQAKGAAAAFVGSDSGSVAKGGSSKGLDVEEGSKPAGGSGASGGDGDGDGDGNGDTLVQSPQAGAGAAESKQEDAQQEDV